MSTQRTLPVAGITEADALLGAASFASLLGAMLDRQQTMEPYIGPFTMRVLDLAVVAEAGEERIEAVFRERPPVARYAASMAMRAARLAAAVETCAGDASGILADAAAMQAARSAARTGA